NSKRSERNGRPRRRRKRLHVRPTRRGLANSKAILVVEVTTERTTRTACARLLVHQQTTSCRQLAMRQLAPNLLHSTAARVLPLMASRSMVTAAAFLNLPTARTPRCISNVS
ncbi:hypothetical protein LTS18_013949, partial [Coniosporium uncinatum]